MRRLGEMYAAVDLDERERATDELMTMLVDHETDNGVFLPSSAWLVTANK